MTAGCVLAGPGAAFAAGGDLTLTDVQSDFTAGAGSVVLGADVDDATSRSTTLELYPNHGPTATTVLDLAGHTLGVAALQLTTFDNGSPQGANLKVVDSVGGGVLRVTQTSTTRPAIEVDAPSTFAVLSGSVVATGAPGSTAAVVGGGPVADPLQHSGLISTNGSGRLTVTGNGSGAAIGSGDGAGAGGISFGGSSRVTATNTGTGAAIGDGNGAASSTITIANQAQVTATQNGTGATGAALGGGASPTGQTAGTITIGDDASVTAVSRGAGAALGGGYHGDGGTISVTGYAHVTATGAQAAIGDGEHATGGGSSMTFSGQGVVVDAHGGTSSAGGAGVGGGSTAYGNDSLSIGNGATVTARSDNGPGIGGIGNSVSMSLNVDNASLAASGSGSSAAAIGAGSAASVGSNVAFGSGAAVTVANTSGTVIGGATQARFGSLSNSGSLTLPAGQSLVVPVNATASNDGAIANSGSIVATGTLSNSGSIVNVTGGTVSGSVSGNDYRIVYDAQTGTGSTTQYVYAPSVTKAQLSVPSANPPSTGRFTGWNTQTDGSGATLSSTSSLVDLAGSSDGAQVTLRLYALYQLNPVLPGSGALPQAVVGKPYSVSVAATAGTAPIGYDMTGVPAGLTFANGAISGTPTTAGSFTLHLGASNGAGSAEAVYTMEVVATPITLGVPGSRFLAGSTAKLTIGGLQANESYTVVIAGKTVATGRAASNGTFTKSVVVPKSVSDGKQTVRVSGAAHATAAGASILTAAVAKKLGVKVSSKKVKAKKSVSFTVSKLYAGESVRVVVKGKQSKTAVGKASSKGVYVLKMKSGLKKGKYTITVTGGGTSRKAVVKLTVK
ncbi:beta strand repeat-containing protein [Amnibacterium setariae]|uniref:Ig-like domain repeat protein n=1 Tax=Amnibacterium setariae TaxID=2306585 RepID=A0A3A1TTX6_9MICO|nr:hypothetical protein [Amnibacterium setariae]RIX27652.1 hypothetical protein D1781_08805 [Amnibacterium setariae]